MPDSSTPTQQVVEKVAEAIWESVDDGEPTPWESAPEQWRDQCRQMAEAAIEALGIQQEYEIHTDGSYHLHTRTLSYSEALNELRKAQAVEAATPNPTEWDRNPQIHTRLVGPWRVGGDA